MSVVPPVLILLLSLSFLCCKSKYQVDNLPDKQLIFGEGGGFTGLMTQYTLLENGQLFMESSVAQEPEMIEAIPRKKARGFFESAMPLIKTNASLSRPGNKYYFMTFTEGTDRFEMTWGDPGYTVGPEVETLFEELIHIQKAKK